MHALAILPSLLETAIHLVKLGLVVALYLAQLVVVLPLEVALELAQPGLALGRHLVLQTKLLLLHAELLFFELQLLLKLIIEMLEAFLLAPKYIELFVMVVVELSGAFSVRTVILKVTELTLLELHVVLIRLLSLRMHVGSWWLIIGCTLPQTSEHVLLEVLLAQVRRERIVACVDHGWSAVATLLSDGTRMQLVVEIGDLREEHL